MIPALTKHNADASFSSQRDLLAPAAPTGDIPPQDHDIALLCPVLASTRCLRFKQKASICNRLKQEMEDKDKDKITGDYHA